MKDFPVFTTEYGIASLVLREIPYQETAYITILDSQDPALLLTECINFCRMCGAERICAKGHPYLERYPLYTTLWEMTCSTVNLPDTQAALWPVLPENLDQWRSIYNEKVVRVPNGAWMTQKEGSAMMEQGSGYFVHRDGVLLGIGKVWEDELQWIASVQPGGGREVVCALAKIVNAGRVKLTVASENKKAVALYEALGFLKTREIGRWYSILHKYE